MDAKSKKDARKKGETIANALIKLLTPSKKNEAKRGYKHKTVKPR